MTPCVLHNLQISDYKEVWDLQKSLFQEMIDKKTHRQETSPLHLIMVEHPHVYTFGKSAEENNMLATPEYLKAMGASVYHIERGGDITYHGPGQLVVYPIFDLELLGMGIKTFVNTIEECIKGTLNELGIESGTIPDRIGVWLDIEGKRERKIAAIGIKCSRYVSMHGLALNANTDLSMFGHIVPCGIPDKEVTSIEKEIGRQIDMDYLKTALGKQFADRFALKYINN